MATFNLCNQFDQLAEGKVVYYGTEHTEYADLEQPKEEKPKKKFSSGRLFSKFLGGLVAVVAVSAVVGLAVAYAASVVVTGGASLAALPAVAAGIGAMAAAFTAYEGGKMVEAQYQNDKANQEEGSWGDYIGGALINTANIGAQEAVLALAFPMAGNLAGRVVRGFAVKYGGKMFAKLGISKTIGKWFRRGMSEAATETATEVGTKAATETATEVGTKAATETATEAGTKVATEAATEAVTNSVEKEASKSIFKAGKIVVDDIVKNPKVLSGKSAEEIAQMLRAEGYDVVVEASKRSTSGAQIIRIESTRAGGNIMQVQVSPGGGRHGMNPYIKISTNDQGIIKIVDGPKELYRTDGKETAKIIFTGGK